MYHIPCKQTEQKEDAALSLGSNLFNARKESGLSQEETAGKLGVSRQTISKWELDETLPDIRQSKKLANLYHLTLDELLDFDADLKEIEEIIQSINPEKEDQIDWSSAWSKKFPILASYPSLSGIKSYVEPIAKIQEMLKSEFHLSDLDAFLVYKDILYRIYKSHQK